MALHVLAIAFFAATADEAPPLQALNPPSSPHSLVAGNGALFFVADDGLHGAEPWCYRPGEGCAIVADLRPGALGSDPVLFQVHAGFLYFSARTSESGRVPWLYDVERREAAPLDANPVTEAVNPDFLGANGTSVFFAVEPLELGGCALVAYPQGRAHASAQPLIHTGAPLIRGCAAPDGWMYFLAGGSLCKTRGQDILKINTKAAWKASGNLALLNDKLFCVLSLDAAGNPHSSGFQPCAVDTDTGEEVLLRPGVVPQPYVYEHYFHRAGDLMYFDAGDPAHGREVWVTNGTPEETSLLKDIWPGPSSCDAYSFTAVENLMFFLANDGVHGHELWKTDGSPENTQMVCDIYPGPQSSKAWSMVRFGNLLALCATSPEYGEEVWVSDGTEQGTRVFRDIVPGPDAYGPHNLCPFQGELYFSYNDPVYGEEIWKSDGTAAGTHLIQDINFPRFNPSSLPHALTAVGDVLFFIARDVAHGEVVWRSDGSTEGTNPLAGAAQEGVKSEPQELTACGSNLFFTANSPTTGRELWKASGAGETAAVVLDNVPGPDGSNPSHLCSAGEKLFFTAADRAGRRNLHVYDAASNATELLEIPTVDQGNYDIVETFSFGGPYGYFVLKAGTQNWLGWTDGTRDHTELILPLPANDVICFPDDPAPPTPRAETTISPDDLLRLCLLYPCRNSRTGELVQAGETTYFVARTKRYGSEVCRTDGTAEGTSLVADVFPGAAGSSPAYLARVHSTLYFIADHPSEGRVLWRSDGTPSGTGIVRPTAPLQQMLPTEMAAAADGRIFLATSWPVSHRDPQSDKELYVLLHGENENHLLSGIGIREGPEGSWPRQLTVAGNRLFCTADDGIHGEEVYCVDSDSTVPRLVRDILGPADLTPRATFAVGSAELAE